MDHLFFLLIEAGRKSVLICSKEFLNSLYQKPFWWWVWWRWWIVQQLWMTDHWGPLLLLFAEDQQSRSGGGSGCHALSNPRLTRMQRSTGTQQHVDQQCCTQTLQCEPGDGHCAATGKPLIFPWRTQTWCPWSSCIGTKEHSKSFISEIKTSGCYHR